MQYDHIIKADNIEKVFRLPYKRHHKNGLHKVFNENSDDYYSFQAVYPVSFELGRGESLGIIGPNGSGKTTLLQLIAGLMQPTRGKISVKGRKAALMELGSGFNPGFTGRENILINGLILGLSKKEIDRKVDEIVEFSGIGDFVEQPVRTYSSGMFMRLAFSVATSVNPDILIIDEVLAVGDAEFQPKCKERIDAHRKSGKTLVIVSHDLDLIESFCDKAIYLRDGRIKKTGAIGKAVSEYKHDVKNENIKNIRIPEIGKANEITLNLEKNILSVPDNDSAKTLSLYSKESLELLSDIWLKVEWNQSHWQSFSWAGVQILQLPEDLLRVQEVIYEIKPDVIIETGVNKGGSSVFFASILQGLGNGRVISIDITIPEEVKDSIKGHPLGKFITLIEGDSSSEETYNIVKKEITPGQKVFVFLDSDHSKKHVAKEIELFGRLVSKGSYIVACDGIIEKLYDVPKGSPEWLKDNPAEAARDYAKNHPEFVLERPAAKNNDEYVVRGLTYFTDAWLKKIK